MTSLPQAMHEVDSLKDQLGPFDSFRQRTSRFDAKASSNYLKQAIVQ